MPKIWLRLPRYRLRFCLSMRWPTLAKKKWTRVGSETLACQKVGFHRNKDQILVNDQKFGRVKFGHHPKFQTYPCWFNWTLPNRPNHIWQRIFTTWFIPFLACDQLVTQWHKNTDIWIHYLIWNIFFTMKRLCSILFITVPSVYNVVFLAL